MSLAAEQSPASTPTPASAPPANMPAVLNREPSQQDLEIARQLQSFQSQGVPSHEASRPEGNAQSAPQSLSQILSDGPQPQKADETLRDIQPQPQQQAQAQPPSPYQPVAQFTPLQQQQPRPQQSPNVSGGGGGQVCSNCGTTKTPLWRRSPTGAVICNACGLYYKARNQMRPVGLKRGAASTTHSSDSQTQERGTSPNAIQGGATYVSADQTSAGTCPGGGRCNGTGGHDGCSGCPAYNNRISKTAQVALRQASREPGQQGPGEGSQTQGGAVQQSVMIACQNCGTTITPLWRRDEAGNTICNACGLYHKLHGHHRPVQMKKAEIKRRKRVVPNHLVPDDQSSVYTAETAEEERRSMAPSDVPSPPFATQHNQDSKSDIRMAGGPIPVDFTDTFRSRKPLPQGEATRTSPNPRKRSFSAAAGDHVEPYAHAQNMTSANNDNIDPSLPARNREPSAESSQQRDKEARRAALQAEAEKMRRMLLENERELAALGGED